MKVKSLVNGIPLQYVVVDGGAEGTLCLRPSGDSCSVRRYGKVASYSVVSWEEAQETVEDFVASAGGAVSPTSTAVHIQWAGISAAMAAVAEFGMVYIQNGDVGVETTYAGKGKVRLWSYGIADAVAPKEAIHLRDLRSWLSERFPEPSTVPWERQAPRANSIAEWLAEHAEQGVFEVDTRDQEVPLYLRAGHSLADWRFAEGRKVLDASSLGPADLAKMARNVGGQECRALRIDVTQNFGWTRGMFGDRSSCWWNEYNMARSLLYHAGGFAVRLWNSEHGVGRIWACPTQDGGVVLFNAYGPWISEGAAALLEHATGIPLWPTTVTVTDSMYINPTTAFVGDVQQAQGRTDLRTIQHVPLAWTSNTNNWEPGDPVTEETLRRPPLCERVSARGAESFHLVPWAFLERADLRGANLHDVDLEGANLADANLAGANLDHANLMSANLERASMEGANAPSIDLAGAHARELMAQGAYMHLAFLGAADLRGANLQNAVLSDASLREATLLGADFGQALLDHASLTEANGEYANFYAANAYGLVADDARLAATNFNRSVLMSARMQRAVLTDASFAGSAMDGADLTGADLRRANLRRASLRRVNLSGADLRGADLHGADLHGANLTGVNLHGARWGQTTIWPEGFVPTAW